MSSTSTFTILQVIMAGEDPPAIKQIGLIRYIDSVAVLKYTSRVNPDGSEGNFRFADIAPYIRRLLTDETSVTWGAAPRRVLETALKKVEVSFSGTRWVDCKYVVRRTWPKESLNGLSLFSLCKMIGFRYTAGDALQEAHAIGEVFLRAIKVSGFSAEAWAIFSKGNIVNRGD